MLFLQLHIKTYFLAEKKWFKVKVGINNSKIFFSYENDVIQTKERAHRVTK